MTEKRRNLEKGQSLVVLAILMLVFLGMLAWVLDGGYAYFMRRNAQNAADAGALAGADIYCETEIWTNGVDGAKEVAEDYAIIENNADGATASLAGERIVQVDTTITFNTFFGSILGQPAITVPASAKAGCYPPALTLGVLPVAWSCRTPVNDDDWSSEDCKFLYGDEDDPPAGQLYIIMDGNKVLDDVGEYAACQDPPYDPVCTDPNVCSDVQDPLLLDCDIDDDHVNDIMAGGERSWLDLDGGSSGSNELPQWMNGTVEPPIQAHIWLVGSDGNKVNAYHCAYGGWNDCVEGLMDKDVILPVFNHLCDMKNDPSGENNLYDTDCYQEFSTAESRNDPKLGDTNSGKYFHIITFAVFHITCISDKPSRTCPVKDEAILAGLADDNTFSIEGYFVSGFVPNSGGGPNENPWVGAYTVYLIE